MPSDFRWDVQRYRDPWTRVAAESHTLPPWWSDIPIVLRRQETWAIGEYRLARWSRSGGRLRRLLLAAPLALAHMLAEMLTGVTISHHATIGRGLYVAHGQGVVIGSGCVLGETCDIYQGVTLGVRGDGRWPVLGDRVYLAPHAVIAGGFTIGDGAVIGPNAVVVHDVEPGQRLVAPAAVPLT